MNEYRRLVRTNDRKIAGVCGGIAEFFDLDPTLVRVGYTLLTVFTAFSGVIAYIIMWIVMPEENSQQ
jgi:phage shock protein C